MATMTIEAAVQGPGHHALVANLLKAMDERKLNQRQLAEALGLEKSKMSKVLNGKRKLTHVELGMAAVTTGWSADQLIGTKPRHAETTWNPLYQEPKDLFKVWATHQSQRKRSSRSTTTSFAVQQLRWFTRSATGDYLNR